MFRRLALCALLVLVAIPVFAQVDKASLEAVVTDQSKSPLPGVTVTVAWPETGFEKVPVTFALEGFAPVKAQKIVLLVGQRANVGAVMQTAASETITVSATAPVVDVHRTDTSTNIVPAQINDKRSARANAVYEKYSEDNFRVGGLAAASYGQQLNRKIWNLGLEHSDVFTAATTNETHLQFGSHKYARYIFVDALPRTPYGKVEKAKLLDQLS